MPIDPSTAIASVKAAFSVASASKNIPLQAQILDLHEQLLALVEERGEYIERIRVLEREVERLEGLRKVTESLSFYRGAYWRNGATAPGADGPFCAFCWDKESLLLRMRPSAIMAGAKNMAYCHHCQSRVDAWE